MIPVENGINPPPGGPAGPVAPIGPGRPWGPVAPVGPTGPADVRREVKKAFRHFEHDAANDCWQADTNHWGYIPDPSDPSKRKKVYLIAIMDDHSRKMMHGEFFYEERYPRLERCVQKAVLKHGVPHIFFCDNGSVYSTKQFNIICARMGTKLIHAKPYSPESKGYGKLHIIRAKRKGSIATSIIFWMNCGWRSR
jgi:hypothetical protein